MKKSYQTRHIGPRKKKTDKKIEEKKRPQTETATIKLWLRGVTDQNKRKLTIQTDTQTTETEKRKEAEKRKKE